MLLQLGLCDDERRGTIDLVEARVPGWGLGYRKGEGFEYGLGLGLGLGLGWVLGLGPRYGSGRGSGRGSGSGLEAESRAPSRAQPQCAHSILVRHMHGPQHRRYTRGVGMAGGAWGGEQKSGHRGALRMTAAPGQQHLTATPLGRRG